MYPLELQTSTDRTMTEDNIIISTTMWWSYVPIRTPNLNRQDNDIRQHNGYISPQQCCTWSYVSSVIITPNCQQTGVIMGT